MWSDESSDGFAARGLPALALVSSVSNVYCGYLRRFYADTDYAKAEAFWYTRLEIPCVAYGWGGGNYDSKFYCEEYIATLLSY